MTFCPIPPFQFQRSSWFTVGEGGDFISHPLRVGDCSCSFSKYLSITVYAPGSYVPRTQKNLTSPSPKWSSQSQEQRGSGSLCTRIQPTEPWWARQMSRCCQQFVGNKLFTFAIISSLFVIESSWKVVPMLTPSHSDLFLNREERKHRKLNRSVGRPMEWGCCAQGHQGADWKQVENLC